MNGVLVVDKPRGPTSHDVVAKLRRALHTKHIGHCGTLDPMATGVLVVAIGEATKLVPWLTADDKSYEATIALGVTTDSLDADGAETERVAISEALHAALASADVASAPVLVAALEAERARTSQVPPAVSAIRIDGRRAHELARKGVAPELAPRDVAVRSLELPGAGLDPLPHLRVRVDAAKGYYVRALARDLATALGTAGHLTALRRTRSGAFGLADATPLPGEGDPPDGAKLASMVMTLETAATRALPVSVLDEIAVRAAGFGQKVLAANVKDPHRAPSAWLDASGRLVAIGEFESDELGKVLRGIARVPEAS